MKPSSYNFSNQILRACLLILVLNSITINASAITKDFEDSSHHQYPAWFIDTPLFDLEEEGLS